MWSPVESSEILVLLSDFGRREKKYVILQNSRHEKKLWELSILWLEFLYIGLPALSAEDYART